VVRVRGKTVNEELVRASVAWVYMQYCKQPICREWSRLHEEVMNAKRGLWADREPVPPWEFRREKRGFR
jgi:micrococcal nuclease